MSTHCNISQLAPNSNRKLRNTRCSILYTSTKHVSENRRNQTFIQSGPTSREEKAFVLYSYKRLGLPPPDYERGEKKFVPSKYKPGKSGTETAYANLVAESKSFSTAVPAKSKELGKARLRWLKTNFLPRLNTIYMRGEEHHRVNVIWICGVLFMTHLVPLIQEMFKRDPRKHEPLNYVNYMRHTTTERNKYVREIVWEKLRITDAALLGRLEMFKNWNIFPDEPDKGTELKDYVVSANIHAWFLKEWFVAFVKYKMYTRFPNLPKGESICETMGYATPFLDEAALAAAELNALYLRKQEDPIVAADIIDAKKKKEKADDAAADAVCKGKDCKYCVSRSASLEIHLGSPYRKRRKSDLQIKWADVVVNQIEVVQRWRPKCNRYLTNTERIFYKIYVSLKSTFPRPREAIIAYLESHPSLPPRLVRAVEFALIKEELGQELGDMKAAWMALTEDAKKEMQAEPMAVGDEEDCLLKPEMFMNKFAYDDALRWLIKLIDAEIDAESDAESDVLAGNILTNTNTNARFYSLNKPWIMGFISDENRADPDGILAQCWHNRREIEVDKNYLNNENTSELAILLTIAHEFGHSMSFLGRHSKVSLFREWARYFGERRPREYDAPAVVVTNNLWPTAKWLGAGMDTITNIISKKWNDEWVVKPQDTKKVGDQTTGGPISARKGRRLDADSLPAVKPNTYYDSVIAETIQPLLEQDVEGLSLLGFSARPEDSMISAPPENAKTPKEEQTYTRIGDDGQLSPIFIMGQVEFITQTVIKLFYDNSDRVQILTEIVTAFPSVTDIPPGFKFLGLKYLLYRFYIDMSSPDVTVAASELLRKGSVRIDDTKTQKQKAKAANGEANLFFKVADKLVTLAAKSPQAEVEQDKKLADFKAVMNNFYMWYFPRGIHPPRPGRPWHEFLDALCFKIAYRPNKQIKSKAVKNVDDISAPAEDDITADADMSSSVAEQRVAFSTSLLQRLEQWQSK